MRRLLRDIAEGRALGDVTTLRDPDVMAQLEDKIKEEQAAESPGAAHGGGRRPGLTPRLSAADAELGAWRRATGIVRSPGKLSSAVPPICGRSSVAARRLATYWRCTRTNP